MNKSFKRSVPEASIKALEEAKKILETSAQANRNLFVAFNFVLITALVLCFSVTDEDLLVGSSTVKLPLLNINLPIWAFASMAPMVMVALHFDLLHNLGEHRDKLVAWSNAWFKVHGSPARNADMPRQLYPFLFDFAWLHANHTGSRVMRARLSMLWLSNMAAAWTLALFTMVQAHIDFGGSRVFIDQALEWEGTSHQLFGLNLVPRLSRAGFRLTLPDKPGRVRCAYH